jgi:hypothetical protein
MNSLLNLMEVSLNDVFVGCTSTCILQTDLQSGMNDAETDLSLVITDMAQNFFPWKDPRTNLEKALPWIQSIVSSLLGFIPGIGSSLEAGANFEKWGPGIVNVAQAFTSGGFQVVRQSGGDPV